MDASFWHARWQQNELGFQLEAAHPLLQKWLAHVGSGKGPVLVPLCGKSPDIQYLANFSSVVGAELSPIACRDFFIEQNRAFTQTQVGDFNCFQGDAITLWQGDFFALTPQHTAGCSFVYDRAALIALPETMRQQYARKLQQLLPGGSRILLITVEYPQHEKQGPPFSVYREELHTLFQTADIEVLEKLNITGKGFARRRFDTTTLFEVAYCITLP